MSDAGDSVESILAEAAARVARLVQRLEASDICDVFGVVHPRGSGGSGGPRAGQHQEWWFSMALQPWKRVGGSLQSSELFIRKLVAEEELKTLMDLVNAYAVVHLKLRVSDECAGGDTWPTLQGLLLEVVDPDFEDPELRQISKDLKVPKIFRDDFFGKLKLNRQLNWLEGTRRRGFTKYRVCITRNGETYDAKMAWHKVIDIEKRMKETKGAVVKELFDIYDSSWQSFGKLTPARFEKKIRLSCIHVDSDGGSSAWFEDGGTFLGHDIEVRIDKEGQIESAHLQG